MIDDTQMKDMVFQFRKIIRDATNKHRRTHAVVPEPEDYIASWGQALLEEAPMIQQVRRPGRPPKRKKDVHVINPEQLREPQGASSGDAGDAPAGPAKGNGGKGR
jgi:hypothetical protein